MVTRDLLLEFWDPSRERFELETSNLVCRLITRSTNDKNEKLGQGGREGSRDLLLKLWDPLDISERLEL